MTARPRLKRGLRPADRAGMPTRRRRRALAAAAVAGWLVACATPRPVLRDVAHRGGVGDVLRECSESDRAYRESSRGRRERALAVGIAILGSAALGAVGGVALGQGDDMGEAVAIGSAAGAGAGLLGGIAFVAVKTQRDSKLRIARCARERGFEVVGWE